MTDYSPDTVRILEQAAHWLTDGRSVALATVISSWGSSPRPVGSWMAVDSHGAMAGSVSGGCVEGAVVQEALEVMETGRPKLLTYGVTDERAWEVGLACGGRIEIHVGPLAKDPIVDAVRQARTERVSIALVTDLATGLRTMVREGHRSGDTGLPDDLLAAAHQAIREDRSGVTATAEGRYFIQAISPPQRLILVGAVHIAQPLASMAALTGYDVTVIDPRAAFATEERFPGMALCLDWPDEALTALKPDSRTAIVALTHDPKLDDPTLTAALSSQAFYIGALGSRKTHAKRLERLQEAGLSDRELARIRGPVGLDIGAVTPAEIAVSILAEITMTLRGGPKAKAA